MKIDTSHEPGGGSEVSESAEKDLDAVVKDGPLIASVSESKSDHVQMKGKCLIAPTSEVKAAGNLAFVVRGMQGLCEAYLGEGEYVRLSDMLHVAPGEATNVVDIYLPPKMSASVNIGELQHLLAAFVSELADIDQAGQVFPQQGAVNLSPHAQSLLGFHIKQALWGKGGDSINTEITVEFSDEPLRLCNAFKPGPQEGPAKHAHEPLVGYVRGLSQLPDILYFVPIAKNKRIPVVYTRNEHHDSLVQAYCDNDRVFKAEVYMMKAKYAKKGELHLEQLTLATDDDVESFELKSD